MNQTKWVYIALGDNIRKTRKEKGWSQGVLAERVDSDPSYMVRIETGRLNLSITTLVRIFVTNSYFRR